MPPTRATSASPRMSDAAVQAKTGKTWPQWFAILDSAGAVTMSHQEIVAYLRDEHGVGPWWQQSVTVAYEQARGLRELHEMPQGYQVSVSKTLPVPAAALYQAWAEEELRGRWLPEVPLTVRKTTRDKSLRITWPDGQSSVEVMLYPKGNGKAQIVVQHSKLPNAAEGERMKAYWRQALGRLQGLLKEQA